MTRIEDLIKGKGYKLVDEQPPFRIYEKHKKYIVYHISSDKIWDYQDLRDVKDYVKDVSSNGK